MAARYEVLEVIGEGGAGAVHRARGPDGKLVAIKLLKRLGSPVAIARFEREQRLLRQLGEVEGFVPLLDAGSGAAGPWIVMPLLEGGTLRERIAAGPRLSVAEAVAVTGRLAMAMGRAHARGLVHRDLKPENVLFATADIRRPLIADLGLAKHWRRDLPGGSVSLALSRPGEFAGTAGYTAPEQMASSTDALPSADVFSLGSILYECLSSQYAFRGTTFPELVANVQAGNVRPIRELVPECPDELAAIIDKALALAPGERYPDARDLARALASCPLVRREAAPPVVLADSADLARPRDTDSAARRPGSGTSGRQATPASPSGRLTPAPGPSPSGRLEPGVGPSRGASGRLEPGVGPSRGASGRSPSSGRATPPPAASRGAASRPAPANGGVRGETIPDSTASDTRPTGASVFEFVEPSAGDALRRHRSLIAVAVGSLVALALVGASVVHARGVSQARQQLEATVAEIKRFAQLARDRAETRGPSALEAGRTAVALLETLPPEARDRALEAEAREAVAWGQLAAGDPLATIAAAGTALTLASPGSPAADSLQLLRARAQLKLGQTDAALASLATATNLEARRLRATTLLGVHRWAELEDLAPGRDDVLGAARRWARFRRTNDAAAAREDLKALGPAGREALTNALRLAEARDRLLAIAVPGETTEVIQHPQRPFETLEAFINVATAAYRSPSRTLLDAAEDAAAVQHAVEFFGCYAQPFALSFKARTLTVADHLEDVVALVDPEPDAPARLRADVWMAFVFGTIELFGRYPEELIEPRRPAQAARLARVHEWPPFSGDDELARRRAWANDQQARNYRHETTLPSLVDAFEKLLDVFPTGPTLFCDVQLAEGLWRETLAQSAARLASTLAGDSPERARLLDVATAQAAILRAAVVYEENERDSNALEFLIDLVRGDDAAAEALLVRFRFDRVVDDPAVLSRSANELFLAGELRRRQGRALEAIPLLERAMKLRETPANSDGTVDSSYLADPIVSHALALRLDPARREDAAARLERFLSREKRYPPVLPWLLTEARAALGRPAPGER